MPSLELEKNKACVLLVRAVHLTGKHRTPTGEPELMFLIIACLISFALTPLLVVYPFTNTDLNPSLKMERMCRAALA